jgi:tetratricopeptide (TPR) repeat protein
MKPRRVVTTLLLTLAFCLPLFARPQQGPLTKDQVINMVKNRFGDKTGARSIEQRGIDFDPTPDFLESLKDVGASDVFIQALQRAKHGSTSAKKPLGQVQGLALLGGQVASHRVAILVEDRGIDFDPKEDFIADVARAGGDEELQNALRAAKVVKAAGVSAEATAQEAEVRQHVSRSIEFSQKGQFPDAEREIRAALRLWPNNSTLLVDLASVLQYEEKWDESIEVLREALRVDPNSEVAHMSMGVALGSKQDADGAIAEFRIALRLQPNDDNAHYDLGVALMNKRDADGSIAEYREAIRLNPKNAAAHYALGKRLRFDKRDDQGAFEEFRQAYTLEPGNSAYKTNYEDLKQQLHQ